MGLFCIFCLKLCNINVKYSKNFIKKSQIFRLDAGLKKLFNLLDLFQV